MSTGATTSGAAGRRSGSCQPRYDRRRWPVLLQAVDDGCPDMGDLLADLLGRHARELDPEIERVSPQPPGPTPRAARPFRPAPARRWSGPRRTSWRARRSSRRPRAGVPTSPERGEPSQTRRIRTTEPVPPASPNAVGQAGQSRWRRHPLHEDAGSASGGTHGGGNRHGRAQHRRPGARRQASRAGISLELAQILPAEHRDESRELRLEASDGLGLTRRRPRRSRAGARPRPRRARRGRDGEPGATPPPRPRVPWAEVAEAAALRPPTRLRARPTRRRPSAAVVPCTPRTLRGARSS